MREGHELVTDFLLNAMLIRAGLTFSKVEGKAFFTCLVSISQLIFKEKTDSRQLPPNETQQFDYAAMHRRTTYLEDFCRYIAFNQRPNLQKFPFISSNAINSTKNR